MATTGPTLDALLPADMAARAETIGISKAKLATAPLFTLAVLAGAFIALGAIFFTTIATGMSGAAPYGIARVVPAIGFCLGLILVVVAGAELFTGNNLIVMAWAGGKITLRDLLRNWGIVYAGNFAGSIATALLIVLAKQYTFADGAMGTTMLGVANAKVNLDFVQAIALGILCNGLVCLAVWLTYSARSVVDKIAAILFPITAFVAAGFEHSVANMYFIPVALFIRLFDSDFAESSGVPLDDLTWDAFLINNLLPVTIGNIIGGTLLVAGFYWFVYLRHQEAEA